MGNERNIADLSQNARIIEYRKFCVELDAGIKREKGGLTARILGRILKNEMKREYEVGHSASDVLNFAGRCLLLTGLGYATYYGVIEPLVEHFSR